jgi:hypothetical protein
MSVLPPATAHIVAVIVMLQRSPESGASGCVFIILQSLVLDPFPGQCDRSVY